MTTVIITIDDPNGLDSNLFFPSTSLNQIYGTSTNPTRGVLYHRPYLNGVPDTSIHRGLVINGFGIGTNPTPNYDIFGYATTMELREGPDDDHLSTLLMHATFALDGGWLAQGGLYVTSLASLTPDALMIRVLQRSTANLVIIGNVGNDTLTGSLLNDTLRGGPGGDQLNGRDGIDTASYDFSSAAVTVNLATGVNTGADAQGDHLNSIENIVGSSWNDKLTGDAGNTFIDGGLGFDRIDGGDGDDFIFGRDGGGVLSGGAGNDRVDGGVQADTIYGGLGNDELRVGDGNNTAYGEDGNDILLGASGIDRLYGGAGTDTLDGVTGNDILDGGTGADSMFGGSGAGLYYVDNAGDLVSDSIVGDGDRLLTSVSYALQALSGIETLMTTNKSGLGALNLTGNGFAQAIYGNAGANILNGMASADSMTGYGGNDRYYADNGGDKVIEAAGGGADEVFASVSYALTANSEIELLTTTSAAGVTAINLTGNALGQTIEGNTGANVIDGKGANDTLRGRGGSDTFAFTTTLGVANIDTILDYNVAADTISLENAVFTGLAAGVLAAAAFFKGTGAHDADDRIIYNPNSGALFFDKDGTGGSAAVRFATVSAGLSMTNNDFVVV